MRCHQMCRPEPNRERQLGPMHYSPGCHGGLLAAGNTLIGICAAPQQVTPIPTAPRTNEAIRPAALKQELGAVRFVRKPLLKCEERVRNGHRPRSCPVDGSESSQTWDNGISLPLSCCFITAGSITRDATDAQRPTLPVLFRTTSVLQLRKLAMPPA